MKLLPLILSVIFSNPALAESVEPIKSIHIVCDHWPKTCNRDGSGLYLDLLREIFIPHSITVTHAVEPFKRGLVSVSQGKADAMPGAFLTPRRAAAYTYPLTRISTEFTALLRRANQPAIDSPFFISGKVIKIRGYDYTRYKNPNISMIEVSKSTQAIEMLATDRADYFMNDYHDMKQAVNELGAKSGDFVITLFARDPTYVIFQKNSRGKQLKKLYDQGMQRLYKNGRIKELVEQYQLEHIYTYYPELEEGLVTD